METPEQWAERVFMQQQRLRFKEPRLAFIAAAVRERDADVHKAALKKAAKMCLDSRLARVRAPSRVDGPDATCPVEEYAERRADNELVSMHNRIEMETWPEHLRFFPGPAQDPSAAEGT